MTLRNLKAKFHISNSSALLTLSLNTFIRYYSLTHAKFATEISRRMKASGGYDYYGSLSAAVCAKIGGASNDEIQDILSRSSNLSEVNNNKAAYEVFLERFGTKNNVEVFERKGTVKLCGGKLAIYIAPIFSVQTSKSFDVYNIWASQSTELKRENSGVGVHLMRKAFANTVPNYSYKMFDTVEGRVFGVVTKAIPETVEEVANTIVRHAVNS